MKRLGSAVALAAALVCLTGPAPCQAQNPPHIPCEDSLLSFDPRLACTAAKGKSGNDVGAVSDLYTTWGRSQGASLSLGLVYANHLTYFKAYAEARSVDYIKTFNEDTGKRGADWSAIRTEGDTSYMTFTIGRQSCIGFDHAGPLRLGGYGWVLRGYFCAPSGQTASYAMLKGHLAATRVGPLSENRNAFGQSVAVLP